MNTYESFIFKDYSFDTDTNTATFQYAIDDAWHFSESFSFGPTTHSYSAEALDVALQLLFFIAGVSYYKTFVPSNIVVKKGAIDSSLAAFLSKTYQKGLGEFFYQNKLDVQTACTFPVTAESVPVVSLTPESTLLIAIGGGKDSLVTYDFAQRAQKSIRTWSLDHTEQMKPLIERMESANHIYVERMLDPQIFTMKEHGALNGHVPVSAIFAAVSTVLCVLHNVRDSVMSNEQSANEPTLFVKEVAINHQYSKSQDFEEDYQAQLLRLFSVSLRYYSLLRPYSEAKITKLFAERSFVSYKDVFSSCNRAYVHTSTTMSWCGECPKCAFIFLALSAFLPKEEVVSIWGGKNLLSEPALETTYKQLLGLSDDGKPFECVGEIKECRTLFDLVITRYPELSGKYSYDIPADYDWNAFMPHAIPDDIVGILER